MDTHSSMAAAAAAAVALYKQLSTLAGFVSQSSVTRTGHADRRRTVGREGERDMDRPGAIDRRELIGMAIPWSPRSGRGARGASESIAVPRLLA